MRKIFCEFLALMALLLCSCGQAVTEAVPTWQEQCDLGEQSLQEHDYENAISRFSSAIEIDPQRAEAYIGRGDAYYNLDSTDNMAAALKDYEAALNLDDSDLAVYLKIADIHIAREEHEQLHEILTRAREQFGDSDEITEREKPLRTYDNYYKWATEYLQNKDYDNAISAFTTAIELDAQQVDAYLGRGDAYISSDDTDQGVSNALADYQTALTLDDNRIESYLKITDIFLTKCDIDSAQAILDKATEKFEDSSDIHERQQYIQGQKSAQMVELLTANVWDTSWQTNEYHIFFPNAEGLRIIGDGSLGSSYMKVNFSYTPESEAVMILQDGYTKEWSFDKNENHFTYPVEEYGDVYTQYIEPIPFQTFFVNLASLSDNEIVSNSYWNDFLELFVFCKKNLSDETTSAKLQDEQENWQTELFQEMNSQGIDPETQSGAAWKEYYCRKRITELLDLPFDDSNPPIYRSLLTEADAMQIALDHWNVNPGDIDEDTGYELYVGSQGKIETASGTYYSFNLYWMVTDGYLHSSTIDMIYVDAQTGACQQDIP